MPSRGLRAQRASTSIPSVRSCGGRADHHRVADRERRHADAGAPGGRALRVSAVDRLRGRDGASRVMQLGDATRTEPLSTVTAIFRLRALVPWKKTVNDAL